VSGTQTREVVVKKMEQHTASPEAQVKRLKELEKLQLKIIAEICGIC